MKPRYSIMAASIFFLGTLSVTANVQASQECAIKNVPGSTRLAIVLGNGAYPSSIGALKNPKNDASAVSKMLHKLGFSTASTINATASAITDCVEKGLALVGKPDIALLYYSGHGVQIKDKNYLVAVDADATEKTQIGFVPLQPIVDKMQARAKASLVFLDACRNNPISTGASGLSVSTGRNLKRGFVPKNNDVAANHARGLLVAYATSPNSVALDGDGDYSPFTEAILKAMPTPGHSVQRVMSAVTKDVSEATDWAQTPWVRSSLTTELKLVGQLTLEQAQELSANWARRSTELNNKGRRLEAIVAALKGLPEGLADKDFSLFPDAHMALYSAVRANRTWIEPRGGVMMIKRSQNGHSIAAMVQRGSKYFIEVWNGNTKTVTLEAPDVGPAPTYDLSFDGSTLAVANKKGAISIWNTLDGRLIARHEGCDGGNCKIFSLSPDGRRLAYGGYASGRRDDVLIAVYNIDEARHNWKLPRSSIKSIFGVAGFEYGGHYVASFAGSNNLCLAIDTQLGTLVGTMALKTKRFKRFGQITNALGSGIWCNKSGDLLAFFYHDSSSAQNNLAKVKVWAHDLKDPLLKVSGIEPLWVSINKNGKWIALSNYFSGIKYYSLTNGESIPSPVELSGYTAGYNQTYYNVEDVPPDPGLGLPPDTIWQETPTKSALTKNATSLLSRSQRDAIAADRVIYAR